LKQEEEKKTPVQESKTDQLPIEKASAK